MKAVHKESDRIAEERVSQLKKHAVFAPFFAPRIAPRTKAQESWMKHKQIFHRQSFIRGAQFALELLKSERAIRKISG